MLFVDHLSDRPYGDGTPSGLHGPWAPAATLEEDAPATTSRAGLDRWFWCALGVSFYPISLRRRAIDAKGRFK
jgi:hypothetical protein